MTPLSRWLSRIVAPWLLVPLLALIYATVLIMVFLLLGQLNLTAGVYVDM